MQEDEQGWLGRVVRDGPAEVSVRHPEGRCGGQRQGTAVPGGKSGIAGRHLGTKSH